MARTQSTIETAALGRPFQLGMLYDCRSDTLIPGMTLWDQEQLQQNKDVRSQINTEFTVTTSDTTEEKSRQLKVDGELKLSLLGGIVTFSGAARYFNDIKKSFLQQRLTLHYKTTTRFEQLTMNHLAPRKMEHLDVFDHNVATHVVTAVLYGANAHFVFDREVNLSEETKDMKGEVKLAVDMLKKLSCSVGAQAELNMSENEKAAVKQLNCTFYGDFKLSSNPYTFEDAMKVYTDLPKMLGENGEHAVPVKVWLYPLDKLDSRAAKLQRNITTELIRAVESEIDTLNVTGMKCGDLLEDTAATLFSIFHDPIQDFQKFCSEYKQDFVTKLGSLLPEIRGGKTDISALNDLLEAYNKSPFNSRDLQQWIAVKEQKSNQVKALLKQLNELGAEVDENIYKYLLDSNVELVVSYAFPIHRSDLLLAKQKNYLYPSTMTNPSDTDIKSTHVRDFQETSWTSDDLMCMKNSVKIFKDLIGSNVSQSTRFIVQAVPQTSECLSSCILVYDDECSKGYRFVPPSKPTCLNIEAVSDNSITVKLSAPCAATLKRKILYKMKQGSNWKSQPVNQDTVTLENLKEGTDYEIKCGAVGKLDYMVESDVTTCETTQQMVDNHQRKMSNDMETNIKHNKNYTKLSTGNPSVYLLTLKDTGGDDLHRKDFGCSNNLTSQNKTIMLVGATGSGKTTLINGMINYILGVEWSDSCRFKLIDKQTNKTQGESQTSEVTAYQIHYQNNFQVPYSVMIINTPGFGDMRGIAQDKKISEKIRKFFLKAEGIQSLDAVCLVVQSAALIDTQKCIQEILSIFGKDIENNILIMVTFADGQKPPVLEAIKATDIPCVKKNDGTLLYFTFNNSALFAQNKEVDDEEDNLDEMFWKMGKGSMKRFFNYLDRMETSSLQLTKEVLSERNNLEAVVAAVQPLIQTGLNKHEEIKMATAALEQNQTVLKENENFVYEVDIEKSKKIDLKQGEFVTFCHGCNFTCHYPCFIRNQKDMHSCPAMKNGDCTVCPGRCVWNVHHNMSYRFETEIVKEKRTNQNLKKQYEEALGKKIAIEKIIKQLETEYYDVQYQLLKLNDKLDRSLTRLKEIALCPDPLSTVDYIELLIGSEKQSAKPGYMKRIAELEELKKNALIRQKVAK